jgi:hypothetical protein
MIPLGIGEIAAITRSALDGVPGPSAQVTGPATCHSRQVTPGVS